MSETVNFSSVEIGQGVRVRLRNIRDGDGTVVDPVTITGYHQDPSGNETTVVEGSMTHNGTGDYEFTLTPDEAGTWYARIETTTPDVAFEVSFTVTASEFS